MPFWRATSRCGPSCFGPADAAQTVPGAAPRPIYVLPQNNCIGIPKLYQYLVVQMAGREGRTRRSHRH